MANGVSQVLNNIDKWEGLKRAGLTGLAQIASLKAENYAKTRKLWKNQSSHAVQGLKGRAGWEGNKILAAVAHSVAYGIFLELAHGRKYKILEEAIGTQKQDFFNAAKDILK